MARSRATCCFILGLTSYSTAFILQMPGGGRCGSPRSRPRGAACRNLLPSEAETFAVVGSGSATAVGSGVVASHSGGGLSDVWLAAGSAAPGDAYVATGLFGLAAAAIAVGTGYLVYSAVSGETGLGSFLSKEKDQNPFYKDGFSKRAPRPPGFLNKIRLPEVDFVEVYNQPPAEEQWNDDDESGPEINALLGGGAPDANVVATAESLRQQLLEAVQAKDYALASKLERELASFMRKNGMSFEDDGK